MVKTNQAHGPVANSLLFADVKGYSKLTDSQVKVFLHEVIGRMARVFEEHKPIYSNTWGDAVFAIYSTPKSAAKCGLALCDEFRHEMWDEYSLPKELAIRVSLHFGEFQQDTNPITGRSEYLGANINLAARVEPIVGSNQVWATERFVNAMEPEHRLRISVQAIGRRELVKGFGSQELFRISHEPVEEVGLKSGSYWNDPQFKVRGIHHINLPVRDLDQSLDFYKRVLNLRESTDAEIADPQKDRLKFKFPGAWLHFPDGQQIHLIQICRTEVISQFSFEQTRRSTSRMFTLPSKSRTTR